MSEHIAQLHRGEMVLHGQNYCDSSVRMGKRFTEYQNSTNGPCDDALSTTGVPVPPTTVPTEGFASIGASGQPMKQPYSKADKTPKKTPASSDGDKKRNGKCLQVGTENMENPIDRRLIISWSQATKWKKRTSGES